MREVKNIDKVHKLHRTVASTIRELEDIVKDFRPRLETFPPDGRWIQSSEHIFFILLK